MPSQALAAYVAGCRSHDHSHERGNPPPAGAAPDGAPIMRASVAAMMTATRRVRRVPACLRGRELLPAPSLNTLRSPVVDMVCDHSGAPRSECTIHINIFAGRCIGSSVGEAPRRGEASAGAPAAAAALRQRPRSQPGSIKTKQASGRPDRRASWERDLSKPVNRAQVKRQVRAGYCHDLHSVMPGFKAPMRGGTR